MVGLGCGGNGRARTRTPERKAPDRALPLQQSTEPSRRSPLRLAEVAGRTQGNTGSGDRRNRAKGLGGRQHRQWGNRQRYAAREQHHRTRVGLRRRRREVARVIATRAVLIGVEPLVRHGACGKDAEREHHERARRRHRALQAPDQIRQVECTWHGWKLARIMADASSRGRTAGEVKREDAKERTLRLRSGPAGEHRGHRDCGEIARTRGSPLELERGTRRWMRGMRRAGASVAAMGWIGFID